MKRITWNQSELNLIAIYLVQHGVTSPDDRNYLTTVRQAQELILDEDRHRPITTKSAIKTLEPVLLEVSRVKEQQDRKQEELIEEEEQFFTHKSIDHEIEMLANSVAILFAHHLKESMSRIINDSSHELYGKMTGLKPKKKKILIVGLLPQQAGIIISEYGSRFDIRFVETNDNLAQLKSKMAVDYIFAMVGKISHPVEQILEKHESYIRVSGLMTGVRKLLDGMAS